MKKIFQLAIMACAALSVHATDYTHGLSIWFNKPITLENKAIWFGNTPEMWKGENKPESAGDTAQNPDDEWESQSLPIGNGSLGANIMGSVEAERITFNEKTLWRGGPNTAAGPKAYWDVNKQSAHVLDEIRQAFMDGDEKKADQLTRKNFNSTVPYESWKEKPFRFGNFTTMGEFYVETGLSTIGMSDYKRILSLDSALAVVQFNKDDVTYERNYFISYPNNVMAIRFKADKAGKQNLAFSYEPNPVSTGKMEADGSNGLVWKDGEVKGLCAKGNFEVNISWKDGELTLVEILSKNGGTCEVRYKDAAIKLPTSKGKTYQLDYVNGKLK